jgi:hypothetical protein
MRRILAFVLLLGGSVTANTYYVKPGGSDASNGLSWSTAWRSVAKVNASMKGGDTCYFGPGTYAASHLIPATGGTSGDRTAYISGDGSTNSTTTYGLAHLCGGDSLPQTGWTIYSGNVYQRNYVATTNWADTKFYVVTQGDSLLEPQTGIPSSPGKFYYNTSTQTLYVYLNGIGGNYNPASYGMWTGTQAAVDFSSAKANYVTILGFDIRYAEVAGVFFGSSGASYALISHCTVRWCGNQGQSNAACIGSRSIFAESSAGVYNTIRACSLDYVTDEPIGERQRYGTDFYSENFITVESCWVGSHLSGGIYLKGAGYGHSNTATVRYNHTSRTGGLGGIDVRGSVSNLYIYGNIVEVAAGGGVGVAYGLGDGATAQAPAYIYNNTIYGQSTSKTCIQIGEMGTSAQPIYVCGNILYGTNGASFRIVNNNEPWVHSDSNLFYAMTYAEQGTATRTLSQWRALGPNYPDVRSVNTNPGFDDLTWFSRSGASSELNIVLPDGRLATRYGAWQPGGTVITLPVPLSYVRLDSIRCDYYGEYDSLRIRFQAPAQSGNDSVILAFSLTNTLPSVYSTDRWAKAFISSKTDSSVAIRSITEPATVIIGGWVKRGSYLSAGTFDTLVLHTGASGTKPLPPTFVHVDSVISDFSGETDSLRFRFGTSSQSWPDSVVVALTTNSLLPSWNQAGNRWAKSYRGANRYDTLYVTPAIVETDTIIAAAWIKDNDSGYSSPAYFVFTMHRALNCACGGTSGNVDGSTDGSCDISDLVALELYLFNGSSPSTLCLSLANVDGSVDGAIDLNDLTVLISYLFDNGPGAAKPAPCH